MNLYLIDYENVTETGLSGTNELTADDHVIVFYSAQIKNISFEKHVEIAQCPATFEYIKIQKTGKNYLDFQPIHLSWISDRQRKCSTYLYRYQRHRLRQRH